MILLSLSLIDELALFYFLTKTLSFYIYNLLIKYYNNIEVNIMRILVIEDEKTLCEDIAKGLRIDGYEVDTCNQGDEALDLIFVEKYDLIVLDLNLPVVDGMDILKTLRKTDKETRVLILSARSELEDKVSGLDAGANDYLGKPFNFAELEARIRSLTRRKFVQYDTIIECGRIKLDTKARIVYIDNEEINFTKKEMCILEYLMINEDRLVSQEELLEHVWDKNADLFSNAIRVHISSVRKKIKNKIGIDPVENIVGQGYRIRR